MRDPRLLELQTSLANALRVVSEMLNEQPTAPTQPEEPKPVPDPVVVWPNYGVWVDNVDEGWTVRDVRHLSPEENKGRHGVYVNVWDAQGNRVRDPNLRIGYTWNGRHPDEKVNYPPLDKPDGELGHGVVDIYPGAELQTWIDDGVYINSAMVYGLHTNHPDEPGPQGELWNSRGHHSFQINFVKR